MKHICWDEVPVETMNPLFDRQFVVGDRVMVARILMKEGCLVPQHSHLNEQISHILSGVLQFTIDGKEIVVKAGEVLLIPPHLPHAALALEDTIAIDTFTPPREDWINKSDQYLRG
ncbi:MAG TPA: cupin domain-containing protein [Bryobacteraceae bacterium]